jgi:hypothetical protein
MRAFLAGVAAAIAIAVIAAALSYTVDLSARDTYRTSNVRL